MTRRDLVYFLAAIALVIGAGLVQSWNVALAILNFGLISAILAIGVNIQWGYAGLFNIGITGFVALGGLAVIIVSTPPVVDAWHAGGARVVLALAIGLLTILAAIATWKRLRPGTIRALAMIGVLVAGLSLYRWLFDPAVLAIESVNPAGTGYLGGLGLPVLLAWPVGGLLAALAAVVIGKIALGLRSDYLAIATLGIGEVVVAVLKHEDWLTRGVKNVAGLPRPVPYEVDLQAADWFVSAAGRLAVSPVEASSIFVKLCYAGLLVTVLAVLLFLCERSLYSPWGRMMRAIRENETAAEAMGKDVKARHLHVFVLGSMICGIAGAMVTTLDGQFTPATYQPLRFTFLIWVMVIVGGSGNNWGAILGGMIIWFFWIEVEPIGAFLLDAATSWMGAESPVRTHLMDSVAHMRFLTMGLILLLVMRFRPRGLIPER